MVFMAILEEHTFEMLYPNIDELKRNYLEIINSQNFRKDFENYYPNTWGDLLLFTLLKDFLKNTIQKFT